MKPEIQGQSIISSSPNVELEPGMNFTQKKLILKNQNQIWYQRCFGNVKNHKNQIPMWVVLGFSEEPLVPVL
jgi:hypothetical protein